MKTVNLTISCRRDYMAVFPVDDKQYKALKNRIKKDGEVNVDEACKKLGRATPLNREHAIEHGLIVAESEPFVRAEIDGIIVFENNELEIHFLDGSIKKVNWENRDNKEQWTMEKRAASRRNFPSLAVTLAAGQLLRAAHMAFLIHCF